MTKKIFNNLTVKCLKALEIEYDSRFPFWAKWVTSIDPNGTNGFAFSGDFIKEGTIEVDLSKPHLILAMGNKGSRANHIATYRFGILGTDGEITPTDISTTDASKGWALRVRDAAIVALTAINSQLPPDEVVSPKPFADLEPAITTGLSTVDEPFTVDLPFTLIQELIKLKSRMPDLSVDEIVTYAVTQLEFRTRPQEEDK